MLKIPSAAPMWTSYAAYRGTVRERNDFLCKKLCNFIIALKSYRLTLRTLKMALVHMTMRSWTSSIMGQIR